MRLVLVLAVLFGSALDASAAWEPWTGTLTLDRPGVVAVCGGNVEPMPNAGASCDLNPLNAGDWTMCWAACWVSYDGDSLFPAPEPAGACAVVDGQVMSWCDARDMSWLIVLAWAATYGVRLIWRRALFT